MYDQIKSSNNSSPHRRLSQHLSNLAPMIVGALMTLLITPTTTLAATDTSTPDPQPSIDTFTAELSANPTNNRTLSTLYLNRGKAYLDMGATQNALQDLNSSLAINPNNAETLYELAAFYTYEKDPENAAAYFDKSADAGHPDAIFEQAIQLAQLKKYKNALTKYNQLLALFSANLPQTMNQPSQTKDGIVVSANQRATYLLERGNTYLALDEYENAISDYSSALNFTDTLTPIYLNRGTAYLNRQDYDQAIADFSIVLDRDPSHTDAHFLKGKAHLFHADYPNAIHHLTIANDAAPNVTYSTLLTEAYFYNANYTTATRLATNLLSTSPNKTELLFYIGYGQIASQNYTAAIDTLTDAINHSDSVSHIVKDCFFYRGFAYWYTDQIPKTIADFKKAKKLGKSEADTYLKKHFK